MQQLTPSHVAALLGRVIQSGAQFYLSTCSGAQPGQAIVVEGRSALAAQPIPPGPVVLVQSGNQWLAYPPRQEAGSQRVVQNTRRRQSPIPPQPFLETFVIRIESPEVDDLHVVDAHQFWGVKIKALEVVGGELAFTLRKEGEEDKALAKGGTVPPDWAILARVTAVENPLALVCALLLEHKSGHRTGWEAIPFNSNQTESGSYTIVADLPYPATLLALEGVPNEFEYTLSYGESLDDTQVVDPEVLAENGVDIPANSSVFVEFEHDGSEETPVFVGSLLLKKQGQERRILERLTCTFLATEDGDYDISHQFYPVSIEGIEPEQVEDPPPEEGTLTIRFFIRPSEGEDIPLVFSEEVTKINAPKNSVIFARIENLTGFSLFTATFWLRRKS